MIRNLRAVALLVLLAITSAASAQYSCTASVGNIAFNNYNGASATPATASTTATLTCTATGGLIQIVPWSMQLSNGSSGNCNARVMNGPSGATLSYNIYRGSVAGGVWGNAGCATFPSGNLLIVNGGAPRTVSNILFGQVPAGQFVQVGAYADVLSLTFSF